MKLLNSCNDSVDRLAWLRTLRNALLCLGVVHGIAFNSAICQEQHSSDHRVYRNQLRRIESPKPLLADYPEFFEPILEENHFEAPPIVDDPMANLAVRAWRFSYNARGIIEMPNFLLAKDTAIIMVHPWAIDDTWGWVTPEPNGVADFCTPRKNELASKHSRQVINPFLKRFRTSVGLVMYSVPG
ncbi:MAG: hypothetical protein ACK5AC_17935, partial [Planctomycetota bacterium]